MFQDPGGFGGFCPGFVTIAITGRAHGRRNLGAISLTLCPGESCTIRSGKLQRTPSPGNRTCTSLMCSPVPPAHGKGAHAPSSQEGAVKTHISRPTLTGHPQCTPFQGNPISRQSHMHICDVQPPPPPTGRGAHALCCQDSTSAFSKTLHARRNATPGAVTASVTVAYAPPCQPRGIFNGLRTGLTAASGAEPRPARPYPQAAVLRNSSSHR